MTDLRSISFSLTDIETLNSTTDHIAVFTDSDGKLDVAARRINRLTKGGLQRLVESDRWAKTKQGDIVTLAFPAGLASEAVHVVHLPRRADQDNARKAGAALAKAVGKAGVLLAASTIRRAEHVVLGLALRSYEFTDHKTAEDVALGDVTVMVTDTVESEAAFAPLAAVAEGVFFTRDLVNEPANILTTDEFGKRLATLKALGLEVDILEEPALEKLKMGALLAVGQGSAAPSKVVVMRWMGGEDGVAPVALVGKGVVFDTGGISIKPAAGMEDMTMDMGGAGVVAGTMMALAKRNARANVVGLVGLVENMPSGTATRPGDVVTSMKGDTIEVINTDAEGRLVLCDVMWYAQETYKPAAMIDLATLTGACIIALGHENAAVYANNDPLAQGILKSAEAEGEGAWRMPLGQVYDDMLKSKVADMKNIGGRAAGSITAAQFLKRFVDNGTPWAHLDIAGVAHTAGDQTFSPKGATGWGVMTLNRLIADRYEVKEDT